jgi:2-dehydro-3-deoxyphosphooctonate aldolase (KDO 8-P synthase)
MDTAGTLKDIAAEPGHPLHLQEQLRQGQPLQRQQLSRPGIDRAWRSWPRCAELGVPVLTDVHSEAADAAGGGVVDVLQTPAFLCRQTDFIRAVAQSGKPVNIKKGQFLAPGDMKNVIDKARAAAREAACPKTASWPANAAPASATTTW